ncbi:protein kinase NNK1 [Kluyveromyces lactis]|uniref:non-specific serine/threonine protein kinase n=1 Tax=Kluyveromyces lactis (strain ATCC 8585 / CBS 2359 / DSM 70799 / NBRC 1267 / NRRL Y-1140 / WM37) TaxID=284590 RepID=Q6CXN7_KLULA|nr:uncharacterized protein KLLA0_A06776g [Kluyveromyces lactis]CAH02890.1 KLLA0A06776p [Kluyveromyces lactis]|eukprot:XP_451302.1 uncharacterized protein KLLA0_A06776g [Kluyveromyces lactis]
MSSSYNVGSGMKRSNTPTLYERDFPSEVVSVGSLQSLTQREDNERDSFKLRHKNDSYNHAVNFNIGSSRTSESYQESSDYEEQLSFKPRRMRKGDTNSTLTNTNLSNNDNDNSTNNSNSRLTRVYSETEKANFHDVTGVRMYDDMKYRPMHFQNNSNDSDDRVSIAQDPIPIDIEPKPDVGGYRQARHQHVIRRRFSSGESPLRSPYFNERYNQGLPLFNDMQDEYIPDFDFAEAVSQWQSSDDTNMLSRFNTWEPDYLGKPQKESVLKLDDLHSQVAPIPLPNVKNEQQPQIPIARPSSSSLFSASSLRTPPAQIEISEHDLDRIMRSIPSDFINMPFSQRKKIIQDLSPNHDYKTIMNILKREKLSHSGSTHNVRSRHGSVASKYLNSFTPGSSSFKRDDKGSFILGHRLGKIIGFGAWGMIRECFPSTDESQNQNNTCCKAMKIIKFKDNRSVKRQVLREISIWSKLSHNNILPLTKWKLDDDLVAYCLTDKIDHGTLYDLVVSWGECGNSKISLRERCQATSALALQLIDAVQYMHSKFIAHGDIKLENCLLEKKSENYKDWKLVLCDFGMSHFYGHFKDQMENESIQLKSLFDGSTLHLKRRPSIPRSSSSTNNSSLRLKSRLRQIVNDKKLIHDDTTLGIHSVPKSTRSNLTSSLNQKTDITLTPNKDLHEHINDDMSRIGSLPYAAPELLEPNPPPIGPSADIWAIGVLIFTMLTGKLPFKHEYEPRLRAIITSGKYDKTTLRQVCNCDMNSNLGVDDQVEFQGLFNAVKGCLTKDLTRRWELDMVKVALGKH